MTKVLMTCHFCSLDVEMASQDILLVMDDSPSFMIHAKCPNCSANMNSVTRNNSEALIKLKVASVPKVKRSKTMNQYMDEFCSCMETEDMLAEKCRQEIRGN